MHPDHRPRQRPRAGGARPISGRLGITHRRASSERKSMPDEVQTILDDIMKLTGDKQHALAKRLGVSQSTIWRWLHREARPDIDEWKQVTTYGASLKA